MEKNWYAVHTYSGHENKVKATIERRAESMNLKDKIFRILIPTEQELRTRAGKRQEVQRKIFPRLRADSDDSGRQYLVSCKEYYRRYRIRQFRQQACSAPGQKRSPIFCRPLKAPE